jgi:hypothetical protein
VYGGGGIMPDIQLAERRLPSVLSDLEQKQVFFTFAVKFAARHKEAPANYGVTPEMREEFNSLLKSEKIEVSADSLAAAQRWVDLGIRRELARRYVSDDEAYHVTVEQDPQVTEAAALFEKAPTLPKLLALASELQRSKIATSEKPEPVR